MNRKIISIGLGAGLAAGTLTGLVALPAISGAQTAAGDSTTATAPADRNRPDPATRFDEALTPLVDAGTITRSQADAVIAALVASHPQGGMKGHGGPGLDVAAQALGMTTDDLHTALDGGQTLAQVAESKGVNVQVLIDALVAERTNHIGEEVASGEITQEQADRKLADLTQRVTDEVTNGRPQGGRGGKGGHGPRGPQAPPAAPTAN